MKKLKQLCIILGMVKKFFPRLIKEFKDFRNIIDDIKYEWFLNFPPKELIDEVEREIKWKKRSDGATSIFKESLKKYDPIPEDEDIESDDTSPTGVPDGRSYFKKKEKK